MCSDHESIYVKAGHGKLISTPNARSIMAVRADDDVAGTERIDQLGCSQSDGKTTLVEVGQWWYVQVTEVAEHDLGSCHIVYSAPAYLWWLPLSHLPR